MTSTFGRKNFVVLTISAWLWHTDFEFKTCTGKDGDQYAERPSHLPESSGRRLQARTPTQDPAEFTPEPIPEG